MGRPEDLRDAEFSAFVLGSQERLLRFGWVLTADWRAAEDLVQTALAKTWLRWGRLRRDNLELYVRRIMVNGVRTQSRRRWRGELPVGAHGDADLGSVGLEDEALLREALRPALLALPARQRAVIALRYFEDMSEAQTAAAMGCSVGTVKSTCSRALARLRLDPDVLDTRTERTST